MKYLGTVQHTYTKIHKKMTKKTKASIISDTATGKLPCSSNSSPPILKVALTLLGGPQSNKIWCTWAWACGVGSRRQQPCYEERVWWDLQGVEESHDDRG